MIYKGFYDMRVDNLIMMSTLFVSHLFWFSVKWTLGLKKERMSQLRSHLIFLPK